MEATRRRGTCLAPMESLSSQGNISKFPKVNVWDPYKCLGISRDASEEEVWGACNFLLNQYGGDERSAESIEASFEKLLMASFRNRKRTKINLKSRLKKKVEESPSWVKNLLSFMEVPQTIGISGGRLGLWFIIGSMHSFSFSTSYLDTRTPHITCRLCLLVSGLYLSKMKSLL
ncbi:hypothetical protein LguiA_027974 [Lonicera macranthoides]